MDKGSQGHAVDMHASKTAVPYVAFVLMALVVLVAVPAHVEDASGPAVTDVRLMSDTHSGTQH